MNRKRGLIIFLILLIGGIGIYYFNLSISHEEKYEEYASQELYLLIFSKSELPKNVNVYFPESIAGITEKCLLSTKLYQNTKEIDKSYSIEKGELDNQLVISLNEFIPEFNKILITAEDGGRVMLNIAQYYIQDYGYLDEIGKSQTWYPGTGYFEQTPTGIIMERHIAKGINEEFFDGELSIKLNDKISELGYLKEVNLETLEEDSESIQVLYTLELNNEKIKKDNISRVLVETIWIVLSEGKEINILQNKLPIVVKQTD